MRRMPLADRIWRHVEPEPMSGCWLWTAARWPNGYGQITMPNHQKRNAHRVSYEANISPVSPTLEVHHKCGTRACVNPEHLVPVTRVENVYASATTTAINAAKTVCPSGHPYDDANTLFSIGRRGGTERRCRACMRASKKRRRSRSASCQT